MEVVYSNVSETMQKIYEAHWETGNEIHSKIGFETKEAQRAELLKQKTSYNIEYKNGKRKIIKGGSRSFGVIVNRKDSILSTELKNFIQSRTYASKGTTVVATPMKAGYTEIRRDGKITSRTKVNSVGKGSIDILQKLNYGLNTSSDTIQTINKPFSWQGKPTMKKFKGTHTEALLFMEAGRRNAMSKADSIMRKGLDSLNSRNIQEPLKAM